MREFIARTEKAIGSFRESSVNKGFNFAVLVRLIAVTVLIAIEVN